MTAVAVCGGLLLGVLVGVLSGLIGIGGGVALIPALVYFYGMSQIKAQGTSVATLLLPIGIFAFWSYYKAGQVDVKLAMLIAVGFAVGGWLGGLWAQHLPAVVLRRGFAVFLVLVAMELAFKK